VSTTEPLAAPRLWSTRRLVAATVVAAIAVAVFVRLVQPSAPTSTVLHSGTAHYAVTIDIAKPRIGTTAAQIELTPAATAVDIQPVMPLMGYATPPLRATPTGTGFHIDALLLAMTGPWELRITITGPAGSDHLIAPLTVSG
jgi:hypothetical protein